MMRKLDQRGVAALEFCLVAVPLFILMFAVFDLGRYAITVQSLRTLANAGARAVMLSYQATSNTYTSCTGDPLSNAAKQAIAPFLYSGGLTPQLAAGALNVTASQPGFTMLMPIWGTVLNAPSASTSIPFCGS
jgi:Flp pilus assembly protein TadG